MESFASKAFKTSQAPPVTQLCLRPCNCKLSSSVCACTIPNNTMGTSTNIL